MATIFTQKYQALPPDLRSDQKRPHQLELLGSDKGVDQLPAAPARGVKLTVPPTWEKAKENTSLYLWLICSDAPRVMYANEADPAALTESRDRICHTNLSGGAPACGGGEMWFGKEDEVVITGCSGRYPINSLEQLADAAGVFRRLGYRTGHGGWDHDLEQPRRMVREEDIIWL